MLLCTELAICVTFLRKGAKVSKPSLMLHSEALFFRAHKYYQVTLEMQASTCRGLHVNENVLYLAQFKKKNTEKYLRNCSETSW